MAACVARKMLFSSGGRRGRWSQFARRRRETDEAGEDPFGTGSLRPRPGVPAPPADPRIFRNRGRGPHRSLGRSGRDDRFAPASPQTGRAAPGGAPRSSPPDVASRVFPPGRGENVGGSRSDPHSHPALFRRRGDPRRSFHPRLTGRPGIPRTAPAPSTGTRGFSVITTSTVRSPRNACRNSGRTGRRMA